MKGINKNLGTLCGLGILALTSLPIHAAGYKMEFQSTSVLADAGEAAVDEDAGTNWYNSAGIVYLPQQYVLSVMDVYAPTKFTGTTFAPSPFGLIDPSFNFNGAGSASSHPNSVIPGIHYVVPFKDRYAFGISIVPAWGFKEDYGAGSILRYDLEYVHTKTIDIAPSLAMKLNDKWSVGVGPDFNYLELQAQSHARTQGPAALGGTTEDSISHYGADDWHTGWHAGILFRADDATRIGLNYRSKIVMHLEGNSSFDLTGVETFSTDNFHTVIPLPPVTTLSAYRDITPRWALMGTIAYDQWSVIKAYTGHNYIQPPTPENPSGLVTVVLPQNYKDTWDFSIGTHYKLSEQIMLRGSIKYEPTPTNNADRDVIFPDGEKLGLQIGTHCQITKKVAVDFLYGHVFVRSVPINYTNPATLATSTGHSHTNIDLLGAQLVWNI